MCVCDLDLDLEHQSVVVVFRAVCQYISLVDGVLGMRDVWLLYDHMVCQVVVLKVVYKHSYTL